MSTERKSKSTSTSPTMNDSQSTLNIRQRVFPPTASSSTNYPLGISFLSTSNTLNESEDMAYIEKRTAHNALERQRREGLNSKFQELAHVLPALQQIRRPSKSMIVAKSLEFVSNAVERQTDFEDQLDALRVENAQLLRQAQNSTKRIKKQVETDSTKTQKQPNQTVVKSSATTTTTTSGAIIKSRRLPSRLKPQLRQSSLPVSLLPPKIATEEPAATAAAAAASAATTTMTTASEVVSEIKPQQQQHQHQHQHQQQIKKRQRDDESVHSNTSSSSSNHLLSPNTTKEMETHMKKRKRNYTTNSNHQQPHHHHYQQQQQQQQQQHAPSNNHNEEIHRQQPMHRHRYGSHQPTTNGLDSIITPVQSRQNSITPLSDQLPLPFDNDNNETLIVPTQFDITTSPFGTEQYYNTYDHFEHVSSIPALRTPVGRSSSSHTNNEVTVLSQQQPPPPPYEPTSLDILNSIMQEHHQDLNTTGEFFLLSHVDAFTYIFFLNFRCKLLLASVKTKNSFFFLFLHSLFLLSFTRPFLIPF
ncbi:uncharacterized protein EV154DRAFT_226016 [Mucor mucedo]|uniref:uncharacterized protein n=1 Tax=Mucor mucedo TaxID=29922 RepID=UPI0022206758|nr:uncharacterized protein EV154DRAFT_226016 [Mucor mucedo]KAI7891294.1 hypothetical protein EV154DRAFT_226016 [Mucor mucedo]